MEGCDGLVSSCKVSLAVEMKGVKFRITSKCYVKIVVNDIVVLSLLAYLVLDGSPTHIPHKVRTARPVPVSLIRTSDKHADCWKEKVWGGWKLSWIRCVKAL